MNGYPEKGQKDQMVDQQDGYPIPGQSQPNTSWDAPNGHWDNPDGKGNTTRWLPGGGGPVDHDNNPINRMTISPQAAQTAVKIGFWSAAGAITIRILITAAEAAAAF